MQPSGYSTNSPAISSYWDRAQWPLQSLYFLMPLLVIYELGTLLYQPAGSGDGESPMPRILAESLLATFFEAFGGFGFTLPVLMVVGLLAFQHMAQTPRQPWKPEWRLQPVMWIESLLWALPLLIFALVLFRQPPAAPADVSTAAATFDQLTQHTSALLQQVAATTTAATSSSQAASSTADAVQASPTKYMLLSMGAGIYEELLFRLIGISVIHLILHDLCKLRADVAIVIAVVVSAACFALYHFNQPELLQLREFASARIGQMIFYTLAGCYFGMVYCVRGFGITVAVHAWYDMIYVAIIAGWIPGL